MIEQKNHLRDSEIDKWMVRAFHRNTVRRDANISSDTISQYCKRVCVLLEAVESKTFTTSQYVHSFLILSQASFRVIPL